MKQYAKSLLPFFLALCLAAQMPCFAEEEPLRRQIQQWVQQLGDESFLVRQRAESLLIRTGMQAYPELQLAKQSTDTEVVRRAENILSQIERAFLDAENRNIAFWIQTYMIASHPADKARVIWFLAGFSEPTAYLANGEGLQTLCRLVRFEENAALRLEAAKSLIASPPYSPVLRQKWYRYIRDNVHEIGSDDLLRCVARYAKLWCELDDAAEKTTAQFQEQVRQVGAETLKLLERPENNIQSGNVMDILLHHAVAELQDAAGLIEDRNKTTAAALAIQPAPMQTTELLVPISLYDQCEMIEHFYVGWTLSHRYRLHGAIAHYQKVMEAGHIDLRLPASEDIAKIYASYLVDYPSALIWIDKHLTILEKEYKGSDAKARIALIQKRKTYYLAEQAAAEGNWTDVWLLLAKVWSMPNTPGVQEFAEDVDSLILAHHVCKQQSILAAGFADTMEAHRKTIWNRLETDYNRTPRESQPEKMVQMCNRAAWLLANMDGDYRSALILAEAALKDEPDDVGVLDTLAHVYFLGGKVDEAIRTQEQVVRLVPEVVRFRQALERFKDAKEKIIE